VSASRTDPDPPRSSTGEGKRRALRGYVPQLKVPAAQILTIFEQGTVEAIAVADPEAGRVDDLQLLTDAPSGVRVDDFQVKWSRDAKNLADAELRVGVGRVDADVARRPGPPVAPHRRRPPLRRPCPATSASGSTLAGFLDDHTRRAMQAWCTEALTSADVDLVAVDIAGLPLRPLGCILWDALHAISTADLG
jgi:hypothetical protein